MEAKQEYFDKKLGEYENLMRYAARVYGIPGVVDSEELYQEALLILDGMFHKYDFDPDSVDFRKMFKTEMWHGLWKVLNKYKAKLRDYRKVHPKSANIILKLGYTNGVAGPDVGSDCPGLDSVESAFFGDAFCPTPEEVYEYKESESLVEEFVDELTERLDDDARIILHEMIYPRDWDEVPDDCKVTTEDFDYWRTPRKIPQHVLAEILGWSLIRVRRAVKRVRKGAQVLAQEMYIELMPSVARRKV